MKFLKTIWEHKIFFSFAFSDTGAVRGVRVRAFWPITVALLVALSWVGLLVAGETSRARLAAKMSGNAQMTAYLDRIAELEQQKESQQKKVSLIAQELGILQTRIERFDTIGEKLGQDQEFGDMLNLDEPVSGQGGPDDMMMERTPSIEEVQEQLGFLRKDADRVETALEAGLALSVLKQEAHAGVPYFYPVVHPRAWQSSSYGWRKHPLSKRRHWHSGMDVAAGYDAPIVSSADGIVVYAGYRYAYGLVVEIRHANGFSTRYAHTKKIAVENGQHVKAGDLIAFMGSTGRSTGPHLHFEILKGDEKLNPYPFVQPHFKQARQLAKSGYGERIVAEWKAEQKLKRQAQAEQQEEAESNQEG